MQVNVRALLFHKQAVMKPNGASALDMGGSFLQLTLCVHCAGVSVPQQLHSKAAAAQ